MNSYRRRLSYSTIPLEWGHIRDTLKICKVPHDIYIFFYTSWNRGKLLLHTCSDRTKHGEESR